MYNVEKYLSECIYSVLGQTNQTYEIILVDDGSSDGSAHICDTFSYRYPAQIKVVHKSNEGSLITRCRAIKEATGDILVFLDADDCLRSDALMCIQNAFVQHNCDMVIYNYSHNPDYSCTGHSIPLQDGICLSGESKKEIFRLLCRTHSLNSLCIKAVSRDCAKYLPDYSEFSHVKNGEDLLCSLPLITHANKIVYINQNLYYYRQHPSSVVHSFNPEWRISLNTVHREVEHYIDIWDIPDIHPIHYAREIRSWTESIRSLIGLQKSIGLDCLKNEIRMVFENRGFRQAYEKMDPLQLSKKHIFLATCLYHQRTWLLILFCKSMDLFSSVRRIVSSINKNEASSWQKSVKQEPN